LSTTETFNCLLDIPPLELMGSQAVGEQAQRDYGEIQTTDKAP